MAFVESGWVDFIVEGTKAHGGERGSYDAHTNSFRMLEGETLAGILPTTRGHQPHRRARAVAARPRRRRTRCPTAPWFEPGASWSARRVFVHIVAETAQHAGHADILRETIDGQKSMG